MRHLLLAFTIALPLTVQAQSVIPYNGYLEADGQQSAGSVQMRFILSSDRAGANELWRSWVGDETWHTVVLSTGRFSINLGDTNQEPLDDDTVFASNSHYLEVHIRARDGAPEHVLPVQKLQNAPKAVLAERATSFKVTEDLSVTGNATIGGRVTTDSLQVMDEIFGNITIKGDLRVGTQAEPKIFNLNGWKYDASIYVAHAYTKTQANASCPAGSKAAWVPFQWRDRTGAQICAANSRDLRTCSGLKYRYIKLSGATAAHDPFNKGCNEPVNKAWPWSSTPSAPNTYDEEWMSTFWVVCCRE